ncbi:rod shape-determining protein RodA [Opitutales bacterium ASA1]|uniref:rod shape-determining protein RodA n=1 Tax=Congregicoccus parvus TaxID=3081749 RepID=UPI002B280C3B|nr:rod shape-determining protein RodA [Opitutales bacterium ASA1]
MAGSDQEQSLPIFNWVQRRTHGRIDLLSPLCLLLLSIVGVFFIYSAQVYTGRTQYMQQLTWLALGAVAYAAVGLIDYKIFLKHGHWVWVLAVLMLIAVKVPGIGQERLGAQRWIDLGPVSIQPSEPAKLAVVIMCASILARSRIGTVKDSLWTLAKLALAAGLPMLLILAQPDLGSALVVPPMVFSLLYASNLSKRFFVASLAAFVVAVGIVSWDSYRYSKFLTENNLSPMRDIGSYEPHTWVPLRDYQRNRILAFAAPDKVDPTGTNISWNLRQSLITVGSGGLTGKGWAQGTQAQLGYLPRAVAHNDFIFSVVAEETGFLGSVFVLALFGLLLANGVRIAGMARDRFGALLALGVTIVFAVHVFVNIGMTIGLVPITGLPLPFLSYGGSFLLSCCILQGLVQSVYRFRREF